MGHHGYRATTEAGEHSRVPRALIKFICFLVFVFVLFFFENEFVVS